MSKKEFLTSGRLMEAVRQLEYDERYKVCEAFYQIQQEESCDDSVMCERFPESFEMIDPSLPESSFVPLHWAVNDMDNAIYEIDVYDLGLFVRIVERLGEVIKEEKQ